MSRIRLSSVEVVRLSFSSVQQRALFEWVTLVQQFCLLKMDKGIRCFLVFACLFIVHVLSVQQVNQAKGLKRDAIFGINYVNFVADMFHYLNVGKVGSALVTKLSECTFKCLKEVSCFSFNLAASPDGDGKLWCELLATDKYNASDKFQVNESSHHYSIYVRSLLFWTSFHYWLFSFQCLISSISIL